MTLDAVPEGIEPEKIVAAVMQMPGVEDLHHVHIWAMSTTENALTAHLIASSKLTFEEKLSLVQRVKHELLHQKIHHATIELENNPTPGQEECCGSD
jgi:cobalt-zinc-cadmium efflux system protein